MYKELQKFGSVKSNEPLAKHTTFKIGGSADFFVVVDERVKLIELLRFLDGEGTPYFILGGGSNMLVRDEGFKGVAIHIKTQSAKAYTDPGQEIKIGSLEADAGCMTVAMAQLSIQHNLTGFEWGVGVPGTIGGAVRGNAGAMGGEMKDTVERVEMYRDGEVVEMTNAECQFGYRDSVFKHGGGVVLRVWLKLVPSANKEGMKKALANLQYRNKTQPQGFASTGCIFQNVIPIKTGIQENVLLSKFPAEAEKIEQFFKIGKISAGWLVERAGMKGVQVGKALVSDRHGNFVVNAGGATATDVLALIEQIKEKVYDTTGIEIEEEIQVI